ncbi:signal recognition particle 19 kDa protein [Aeropyrum pernix]|uniref:Signal recognition particle 19 kDa protein n=1 Tax=Aeropyrum pernix TaxID=56636 RepID=A0A401HA41_AERPX|nr:signal recognition particle subunit SRP19/SEC65 family protein [Aeropyrum pernix]GBF09283.1 signal recognition particle 19 kDa protein [Aeropyrum pernix]
MVFLREKEGLSRGSGRRIILWPAYFDSTLPRRLGRRVPRDMGVPSPKPEDVAEAARRAGYEAVVEESSYPRLWWRVRRRIVVLAPDDASKTDIIKAVATELRKIAAARRKRS